MYRHREEYQISGMIKSLAPSIFFVFLVLFSVSSYGISTADSTKPADSLKSWKVKGRNTLNFNQISLSNWAEGGESNISGIAYVNLAASYKKNKVMFNNSLSLGYGMNYNKKDGFRKNEDKIDLTSSFNYKAFDKWYYSALVNLKTQFTDGYKYPDDSTLVSTFFAPAYLTTSLGLNWEPNDEFSLFISPASGRFTFVCNQQLADKGAFGVEKAEYDSTGRLIKKGSNIRKSFGLNIVIEVKKEILKNVIWSSTMKLSNNYLDANPGKRWRFIFDYESGFNMKVNSVMSVNLYLHMIYDPNIMIPTYETIDGEEVQVGEGPKLQFKEHFGIGLSYKFGE